ncbi:MAG: hypothetical protein FWC47_07690 [Oscillospiraceae bacterium]|nr:hypothetical protein [Oscillospiraceae bacterium]
MDHNTYIIRVSYNKSTFFIKGYIDNMPYSIAHIAKLNPVLNRLLDLCTFEEFNLYSINRLEILNKFIVFFRKNKLPNIDFKISKEIMSFKFLYKHDFKIIYALNPTFKCLVRQIPKDSELHRNYIKVGNYFYDLTNPIDFNFKREYIEEPELVKFVRDELPHIKNLVSCDVEFSSDDPLELSLRTFSTQLVEIDYRWLSTFKDPIQLQRSNYFLLGKKIFYIENCTRLADIFKVAQYMVIYRDDEIPNFMKNIFPFIKKHFIRGLDRIESVKIYSQDFQLFLKVYLTEGSLIGKPFAKLSIKLDKRLVKLDEIKGFSNTNSKYLYIDDKTWILKESFKSINAKNLTEFLKSYTLDEREIIYRGSERLPNLVFDDIDFPQSKNEFDLGVSHLKFLLKYGMTGGIIAKDVNQYKILSEFLASISIKKDLVKILIIADVSQCSVIQRILSIDPIFIDSSNEFDKHIGSFKGIFLLPWQLINGCINFHVPKWDVIIFASIEELIQISKIPFGPVMRLKPTLWLNLTTRDQNKTLLRSEKREIEKLLEYYNDEFMNRYLFRDLNEEVYLPPPYVYAPRVPRTEAPKIVRVSYINFKSELEKGNYIDSDMQNILKYVSELLNVNDSKSANEVLSRILDIWFYYRRKYEALDGYLSGWCFDFICIHHTKMSTKEFGDLIKEKNITKIPELMYDVLIDYIAEQNEAHISLDVIQFLTYFDVLKSAYSLPKKQALFLQAIDDIITLINEYLIKKYGENILKMYSPNRIKAKIRAYQNASAGILQNDYTIYYKPYSCHFELRRLITNIYKYTEEALKRYSGKKTVTLIKLKQEFIDIIDDYFKAKLLEGAEIFNAEAEAEYKAKAEGEARPKVITKPIVNIDMEKVQLLKDENMEIIDILAKKEDDLESYTPEYIPYEEAEEEKETEYEDVFQEFLDKVPKDEFEILKYIIDNKGSCEISSLNKKYKNLFVNTLLDDINSLAKKIIGNLIIYDDMEKIYIEEEYIDKLIELTA